MTQAISILVHADSKVGKSTFANTSPAPRLLLDVEAAHRFLSGKQIKWDPLAGPPPEHDGTWETCVVNVLEYKSIERAYEYLCSGNHPFNSVVIDSISELQSRCKNQIVPVSGIFSNNGKMGYDEWGALLASMELLIRGFRDLTIHPTKPLQAVVVTSMSHTIEGKQRPQLQGQIKSKVAYYFDCVGYMYVDQCNPEDPSQTIRRMLTEPHPQFEAGNRIGGLPKVIDNPTVPMLLDFVPKPNQ